ncbi:unnamed protein product [Medioppia subpectinata]|uniref:Uncharacterized protein n=1 Tax=Medioppia subpectinata TaxID=1979941 RepID=A0A7R9LIK8_9ACAR|nr:unnamed protein product [Medioppia subpectinata]CAG2119138.1 unnamed protein product [Medioppia subpectinata]
MRLLINTVMSGRATKSGSNSSTGSRRRRRNEGLFALGVGGTVCVALVVTVIVCRYVYTGKGVLQK